MSQAITNNGAKDTNWLMRYYAMRAAFSVIWVIAAFALGRSTSPLATVLLIAYPAWDAVANIRDAIRNGGLKANLTQTFNAIVSIFVTITVGVALGYAAHAAVFDAFGAWAILAGILQLATAVRRWHGFGAQWPMILSGAQSAVAGTHFISRAAAGILPSPVDVAPYAAFGAIFFAISAGVLALSARRQRRFHGANPSMTIRNNSL